MSRNVKVSAGLVAVFAAVIAVVAIIGGGKDEARKSNASSRVATTAPAQADAESAPATRVVASDPRRLGRKGTGGVTFTEFLDFECESCGAAFPIIEQLRQEYAGRVTFNIRYFPLPGHKNSRNAAHAVEAAHQQGKLEALYRKMYETQSTWGEQSASQAAMFRGFADQLGLDMKAYDADVAARKTAARVQRDVDAGTALGVQSTPSFFVNEERLEPKSVEEIRSALDAALGSS